MKAHHIIVTVISVFAVALAAPAINDEIREVAQVPASIIPGIKSDAQIKVETNFDLNLLGLLGLPKVLGPRLADALKGAGPIGRVINQGSQIQFVADERRVNGTELRDLAVQALVLPK